MRCPRRVLSGVTANPLAEMWRGIDAHALRLAVDSAPPHQSTAVKSVWDADEWRVLFEISDTHVWATLTERGALLYQEEVVEVFIDPVGDLQAYFEIEVNPLNAILEVVARRNRSGYTKDFAWRCAALRTAAQRTPTGWCAELSIPFPSLVAEPPPAGAKWRANFYRIDRPPGAERELSAWSPPGRGSFHTPERLGVIEFAV